MQEILKRQSEKYLARYPKIFFCHVPKCAGVSLSKAIYSAIYPALLKATRFTGYIDLKSSQASAQLLNTDMMTARETQLVFHLNDPHMLYTNGHCIARPAVVKHYSQQWHFVTILRDPVDRFISEFVYNKFKSSEWHRHDDDIDAYIDSEKGQSSALTYARYFGGFADISYMLNNQQAVVEEAVANLRRFSVFGTLDQMDKWQQRFNQRFNTHINIASQNKSPNKEAYTEITGNVQIMERIRDLCAVDCDIYRRISRLSDAG